MDRAAELQTNINELAERLIDAGLRDAVDQASAEQPDPTHTEKKPDHSAANDFSFVSVGSVDYSRRLELALTNQTIAALYHGNNAAYAARRRQLGAALSGRYAGLWKYRIGDYRWSCRGPHKKKPRNSRN